MNYEWIEEYCMAKPGVTQEYKIAWGAILYLVGDKFFAMVGNDKEGEAIISLKLNPERGEILRKQYEGSVTPGYYLNKVHWNSIYFDGKVPDEVLMSMLDESYELVLGGLSAKARKEIMS